MAAPRRWPSTLLVTTLIAASAPACERGRADPSTPPRADEGHEADRASEAAALADAIDPGPVAPMSAELPTWLAEQVAGDVAQAETDREAMIRGTIDAFRGEQRFALLTQPGALLALARVVAILEARDAAGRATTQDLVDLQVLYAVLDQPAFAHQQGMFAQFIPTILALAESAGDEDLSALTAFTDTLFDRMRRAEALRRALVARLLRTDPDNPAVAEVLASVAENLGREDPTLALRAVRLARELHPQPGPSQHLDVAYRCCLVLDLACADEALSLATADPDALDEQARRQLDNVRESRASAAQAVTHASATDLDGRLARARALFDLGLYEQARPVFEALRAEFPSDARPVAGLARIEIAAHVDVIAAARIIAAAGPLEHQDVEFYEVAIAARVLSVFTEVLPGVVGGSADLQATMAQPLVELRADVDGYVATGSELAVVFEALLDLTERAIPLVASGDQPAQAKLLRDALDRAVALQRQLPREPHAFVLLMSAAELMPDKQAAVAAASTPVPSSLPEGADLSALHLRKAQALLNLAITWADERLLEPAEAELAQIPAGAHEQAKLVTAANLYAVAGRLSNQPAYLQQATDAYYAAYQQFQDASAANNLGRLLADSGDLDQARAAFEAAEALGGDKAVVARLNRMALDPTAEGTAGLEAIARDTQLHGAVRRLAMAELARRTIGKIAAGWTRERAALAAEPTILPRVVDLPNAAGALLLGELDFDVSYSIDGLILTADAASTPWLVAVPGPG